MRRHILHGYSTHDDGNFVVVSNCVQLHLTAFRTRQRQAQKLQEYLAQSDRVKRQGRQSVKAADSQTRPVRRSDWLQERVKTTQRLTQVRNRLARLLEPTCLRLERRSGSCHHMGQRRCVLLTRL